MLRKKWILVFVILIGGGVLLFLRMEPDKYLTTFINKKQNETPGLLFIKPVAVQSYDNYVVARVEYEINQQFKPVEHWFIKDRTKIQDKAASNFSKWEGYIFLVKDGLYSWKVIE